MMSQGEPNLSIVLNKESEIIHNVHAKTSMDVSSDCGSTLDEFFKNALSPLGIEFNKVYKVIDLIKLFNEKKIDTLSIKGVKMPIWLLDLNMIDMCTCEAGVIFLSGIFGDEGDSVELKESVRKIMSSLDEEYKIIECRILPNFTSFGASIDIIPKYSILLIGLSEGSTEKIPVITVEIS